MNDVSKTPAIAALLVALLLWGSSFPAMKIAVGAYHPIAVIFGRVALASLVFLLVRRRFAGVRPRGRDWLWLLLMAFSEPCLYFLFEAYALTLTSSAQAGMVSATMPVMTALAAWFFLKERVTAQVWIGLCLAVLGVVWLSLAGVSTDHAPDPRLGNLLEFLAMVATSAYLVLVKHLTKRFHPLFLTAVQTWVGALFYLPLLLLTDARASLFSADIHWLGLGCIVYLSLAVTILAYGCYNFALSRMPASQAGTFVNLIPVIALTLGVLLLGERFTLPQYAASALVLLGVFLTRKAGS